MLLVSVSGLTFLPIYAGTEIGSVAAVNRDMDGTPPEGSRRALALGNQLVSDELIQTSRSASDDDEDTSRSAGNGGSSSGNRSASSGTTTSGGTGVNTGDGTTPGEPPAPNVTEIFEEGIGGLAEQNSGQQDGDQIPPISTSGERPKDAEPEVELSGNFSDSPATQDNPATDPTDPDDFVIGSTPPPPTPDDPPPDPDPDPAPVFNFTGAACSETMGLIIRQSIRRRSIIADALKNNGGTQTFTIKIPEAPADFTPLVDFEGKPVNLFAQTISPNSGAFNFSEGTQIPQGQFPDLGAVSGTVFSDLEEDFHFYKLFNSPTGPSQPQQLALAVIGLPSESSLGGNTVGEYVIDTAATFIPSVPRVAVEQDWFVIIANSAEARFPHPSHRLGSNGGRILGGDFEVNNQSFQGLSFQRSEFLCLPNC